MSGITLEHVLHMPAAELLLVNPSLLMDLLMQADRLRFQAQIICVGLRGVLLIQSQPNSNEGADHE